MKNIDCCTGQIQRKVLNIQVLKVPFGGFRGPPRITQMDTNLITAINSSLDIELPENISAEVLKKKLSRHINDLIQFDFQKLVVGLYRIDVSEKKLKLLLKENPGTDAGKIIADLIIERQLQKIKSREQFNQRDNNIKDEDKW